MYLIIDKVDEDIECNCSKEKNGTKYLVFHSTDKKKESTQRKKYTETWHGIKNEIERINGSKKGEYDKDFKQIKLNTEDNLPLNKPLKLRLLTMNVRRLFEEDNDIYPQLYLDNFLYELCI